MDLLSKLKLPFQRQAAEPAPISAQASERLRTRARRRLIGAAMLLVAGVIVFPLLFEGQPRSMPVGSVITIPNRDTAATLDLPPADRMVGMRSDVDYPAPPQELQPGADPVRMVSGKVKPISPAPVRASAPVQALAQIPAHTSAQASAATPVPPRASEALLPVIPPVVAKPVVAASRPAPRPELVAPKPAATSEERYIVQAGTFTDAASVRDARARIEGLGLKTYVQVLEGNGGRRMRVRVGPYSNRAEADKAVSRLKSAGLSGSVLSL